MIHDSYVLAARDLPLAEKAANAEVWFQNLHPIIPEGRLQECWEKAVIDHETSFAINAHDIIAAWKSLSATDVPKWQIDRDNCTQCDERGYKEIEGKHIVCKHV